MAISREKKSELLKQYQDSLAKANTVVVIKQDAVPVDRSTNMRWELFSTDGEFQVVKKRIFLKALKDAGYEDVALDDLQGSVSVLYVSSEDSEPLKIVNNYLKEFKKDKDSKSAFEYLGGWFDKKWENAEHVSELANLPSKEELLSKLAWLFNYPMQSFAGVLHQIAEKWDTGEVKAEEKKEEKKEEVVEEKTE